MAKERSLSKILWAIDPCFTDEERQNRLVQILRTFTDTLGTTISPVTVMALDETNNETPFTTIVPKELRTIAQSRIENFLKSTKLPRLLDLIILIQDRNSIRSAVDKLVAHAHAFGGDLIAVNTHSRRGVERLFLGSFAETLLLRSDIPTLSVGPQSRPIDGIREIVFPTDLSKKSRAVLAKVIPMAKAFRSKLFLVHHFDLFARSYFPIDPAPAYFKAMEEYELWEKQQGEKLAAQLRKEGVDAEFILKREGASTAEVILEFANPLQSAIIAMASESGPIGSALLGSTTRQIVRSSPWPVWVLHAAGGDET